MKRTNSHNYATRKRGMKRNIQWGQNNESVDLEKLYSLVDIAKLFENTPTPDITDLDSILQSFTNDAVSEDIIKNNDLMKGFSGKPSRVASRGYKTKYDDKESKNIENDETDSIPDDNEISQNFNKTKLKSFFDTISTRFPNGDQIVYTFLNIIKVTIALFINNINIFNNL